SFTRRMLRIRLLRRPVVVVVLVVQARKLKQLLLLQLKKLQSPKPKHHNLRKQIKLLLKQPQLISLPKKLLQLPKHLLKKEQKSLKLNSNITIPNKGCQVAAFVYFKTSPYLPPRTRHCGDDPGNEAK